MSPEMSFWNNPWEILRSIPLDATEQKFTDIRGGRNLYINHFYDKPFTKFMKQYLKDYVEEFQEKFFKKKNREWLPERLPGRASRWIRGEILEEIQVLGKNSGRNFFWNFQSKFLWNLQRNSWKINATSEEFLNELQERFLRNLCNNSFKEALEKDFKISDCLEKINGENSEEIRAISFQIDFWKNPWKVIHPCNISPEESLKEVLLKIRRSHGESSEKIFASLPLS